MKTITKTGLFGIAIISIFFFNFMSCSTEPVAPDIIIKDNFVYANEYLDWCIKTSLDRYNIPGCSVAVVSRDGILFQKSYGRASTTENIAVANDTFFRAASISKPLVAMGIMKLAEQGKVDIDAPITRYIPEFSMKTRFPDAKKITLRHILSHRSGIQGDYIRGIMGENRFSNRELIQALADEYTCFPPEEVYYYSNTAYSLLETVIVRQSGMPFELFMQKELLDPLGMTGSSFQLPQEMTGTFAAGHMKASLGMLPGGQSRVAEVPYMAIRDIAAGGLHSNTDELARLLQYFLADKDTAVPHIVSEKSFSEMTRIHYPESKKSLLVASDYGLGFMINKLKYTGVHDVFQHTGNVNGFFSFLVFSPSQNIGMILCTNSNDGFFATYSVVSRALKKYFEARIGHPVESILPADQDIRLTKKELLQYEGNYAMIGVTAKVKATDSRLVVSVPGIDQQLELIPKGNNRFQPVARFLLWDIDIAPLANLEKAYIQFIMGQNRPVGLHVEAIAGEGMIKIAALADSPQKSSLDTSQFAGTYAIEPDPRIEEPLHAYIPITRIELAGQRNYVVLKSDELKSAPNLLMYPLSENRLLVMGTHETVEIIDGVLTFSGIKARKIK
ncbi:MAG: beta-lactamase family protein [Spirochaetales bacterium]|nr:beta-lactamase family protein [Spirochaetales bacterium]